MRISGAIGVILACWIGVAESATCGRGVVTGLFNGIGTPPGSTQIDVTLNLACADNTYTAQLFTSMGDFSVKQARSRGDQVDVDFDSGASLGTLHLTFKDNALDGTVDLGGDRGTIALKKALRISPLSNNT